MSGNQLIKPFPPPMNLWCFSVMNGGNFDIYNTSCILGLKCVGREDLRRTDICMGAATITGSTYWSTHHAVLFLWYSHSFEEWHCKWQSPWKTEFNFACHIPSWSLTLPILMPLPIEISPNIPFSIKPVKKFLTTNQILRVHTLKKEKKEALSKNIATCDSGQQVILQNSGNEVTLNVSKWSTFIRYAWVSSLKDKV